MSIIIYKKIVKNIWCMSVSLMLLLYYHSFMTSTYRSSIQSIKDLRSHNNLQVGCKDIILMLINESRIHTAW